MSNLATIVNNILADSGIDDINIVVTTGSYTNPSWIVSLPWTKITGTPTTLSGYGITNAYTKTEVDTLLSGKQNTLSLTTTGTSGAATLVGATLNIPIYQSVLTNPVTGTGTANTLAKFTGSSTIGNSIVSEIGNVLSIAGEITIGVGITSGNTDIKIVNDSNGKIHYVFSDSITGALGIESGAGVGINFNTNGANTRMSLTSAGSLEFVGTSTGLAGSYFTNDNTSLKFHSTFGGGTTKDLILQSGGSPGAPTLILKAGGNVLVGTDTDLADVKLNVNGPGRFVSNPSARALYLVQNGVNTGNIIQFQNQSGTDIWEIVGRNNQFYIYNTAAGGASLYINPATNNVSINSLADAGFRLDVNGTARVQGMLTGAGGIKISGSGPAFIGAYTSDGLFGATANPNFVSTTGNGSLLLGYMDNGSGLYSAAIGYYVRSTDGAGVPNRVVGAFRIRDADKNADQFIIFNNGTVESSGSATFSSSVTASSIIRSGGTSSQYLMADGSVSTLTNPVTGTGTTNYLPKFTGTSTIGNSAVSDDGTSVAVGVSITANAGNLQVGGTANTSLFSQQGTDTVRMGVRASGRTGISFDSSNATFTNRMWYIDNVGANGSLTIGRSGLDVLTFSNGGAATFSSSVTATQLYLGSLTNEQLMISGTGSRGIGVSTITSGDPYFRLYNNTTIVGDMWWGRSGSYQGINSLGAGSITAINPFGGNVLIGTTNDTGGDRRLQVAGNVFVNDDLSSGNGVQLRGADRPLITRGWDAFTSGSKTGVGRWGVFMEPAELFLGSPGTDYVGGFVTIGGWLANGTRQPNLSVDNSNRRVGIGIVNAQADLHVFRAGSTPTQTTGLKVNHECNADDYVVFFTGNESSTGNRFVMNQPGNIGVGTASPTQRVHIDGQQGQPATSGTTQNGLLRIQGGGGVGYGETLDMGFHVGVSGPASYGWIQSTNTSNLAINYRLSLNPNGGAVLVGTTTDNGSRLRVGGTIWADSAITFAVGFSSYTPDGLFSANAFPGKIFTPSGSDRIRFGYYDQGGGQYWGRIGFQGSTNWSLGTGAGGHSFVIGVDNGGGGNLVINNAGAATFSSSVTATSFFESSDSRIKTLLEDKLKYEAIANVTARYYEKNGKIELGYFAQDFETLLPSAVSKNEDGYLNLSYREVHTAKIAYLEKRINELEQQLKNK